MTVSLNECLHELHEEINTCEERLRRLERLSKIVTQHVETASYMYINAEDE